MTPEAIYTVGIYGFTANTFLDALRSAGIDAIIDVRQRRAVRGSRYAFANANRLDSALTTEGIAVQSWKDLAPTTELRQRQKAADQDGRITKTARVTLAQSFVDGYQTEILANMDPATALQRLEGYRRPALLCVEHAADACHRSLLARWLAEAASLNVVDLE